MKNLSTWGWICELRRTRRTLPLLFFIAFVSSEVDARCELPSTCEQYCAPEALAGFNQCVDEMSRAECLDICREDKAVIADMTGCFIAAAGNCDAIRHCADSENAPSARFWMIDESTALMLGEIDHTTPAAVERLLNDHEALETIVLAYVPGSSDDEANLEAARKVRAAGLRTVVPPFGMIASGGTDFFLAGRERIIEADAAVGVHSWSDDEYGEGRDLPRAAEEHRLYLQFYREMQIPEDFYWFTLEAASSEEMCYMNRQELSAYAITTQQ